MAELNSFSWCAWVEFVTSHWLLKVDRKVLFVVHIIQHWYHHLMTWQICTTPLSFSTSFTSVLPCDNYFVILFHCYNHFVCVWQLFCFFVVIILFLCGNYCVPLWQTFVSFFDNYWLWLEWSYLLSLEQIVLLCIFIIIIRTLTSIVYLSLSSLWEPWREHKESLQMQRGFLVQLQRFSPSPESYIWSW